MDWSKAKSILIVVMLLLNVFLFALISFYISNQGISRETISNTIEILKGRGVAVETEIPRYSSDTPSLICENGGYDRETIAAKLLGFVPSGGIGDGDVLEKDGKKLVFRESSFFVYTDTAPSDEVEIEDLESTKSYIGKFLDRLGINAANYKLDSYVRNPDGSCTFMFTEKYRNFLVYDNSIKLTASQKGITYLESRHRKIKGFAAGSMRIMPAYQVLLKNFGEGDENVVITGIDIGFKGYIKEEDNMQQFSQGPAWRVTTSNGDIRYFKASDGEEIN